MGRESKADHIYLAVRLRVTTGELQPGAPIKTSSVVEEFSVSRSCAASALKWLVADGYLEDAAPHGYVVHAYTAREVYYRFVTLIALEQQVAACLASSITKPQLRRIRSAMDAIAQAEQADVEAFIDGSRQLRSLQLKILESTPLVAAVEHAAQPAFLRLVAYSLSLEHLRFAQAAASRLIDAYEFGDPDWARAMVASIYFPMLYAYLQAVGEKLPDTRAAVFARLGRPRELFSPQLGLPDPTNAPLNTVRNRSHHR